MNNKIVSIALLTVLASIPFGASSVFAATETLNCPSVKNIKTYDSQGALALKAALKCQEEQNSTNLTYLGTYTEEKVYAPSYKEEKAYAPSYKGEKAYAPSYKGEKAYTPSYKSEKAYTPSYKGEKAYTPSYKGEKAYAEEKSTTTYNSKTKLMLQKMGLL